MRMLIFLFACVSFLSFPRSWQLGVPIIQGENTAGVQARRDAHLGRHRRGVKVSHSLSKWSLAQHMTCLLTVLGVYLMPAARRSGVTQRLIIIMFACPLDLVLLPCLVWCALEHEASESVSVSIVHATAMNAGPKVVVQRQLGRHVALGIVAREYACLQFLGSWSDSHDGGRAPKAILGFSGWRFVSS